MQRREAARASLGGHCQPWALLPSCPALHGTESSAVSLSGLCPSQGCVSLSAVSLTSRHSLEPCVTLPTLLPALGKVFQTFL